MTLATKAFLEKAYLAYFGRPVDPTGLTDYQNSTETQVADAFAASAESKALYGTTFNYAQINAIYLALFNRAAEKAGLEYWYAKVADKTYTPAGAALAILNGALNEDKIAIENKLVASAAFSAALDTSAEMIGYSGAGAAASARSFLSTITTTAATAAAVDAAVAAAVTATTSVSGQTFTLTTGVDTFTGSGNNDLFIADNTGTDVSSAADTLSGGTGNDTLNVYSDGAAGALPALTSVETLNVYDQNANMTTATTSQASLTTVNLNRGDGIMTLTVGAAVTNVGVNDVVAGTGGVVIAAAATATSLAVNLNGVTAAAGHTDENVDVDGTLLTSVTVNTSGTASSFDVLDVASATTININAAVGLTATSLETGATIAALNISGAGAVSLGTLDTAIDTVTSTASGATTAAIGSEVDTVLTLGSGNDVITASTTDTIATADKLSVDAGAGTGDVLVIAESVDVNTAADVARYKNFEILRLTGGVTEVASLFTGLTGLQIISGATVTTGMNAATAANVTVRTGDLTTTTLALADATGTSDVVNVTFGLGTTNVASFDSGVMTLTGFETVNLVSKPGPTATAGGSRTTTIAAFDAINANTINLTGNAFTITEIANDTGTRVKALTVDGSALTGDGQSGTSNTGLTLSGTAFVGSKFIGSGVKDSFTIAAEGSTYEGGAGADAFSTTAALINADGTTDLVLNGGDGTDTLTLTNTTGLTLSDTHFTNLSHFEKLTLTNTGAEDTVITTGAAFNAAFATGATITSGVVAAAKDITINAGLATVPVTVVIAGTSQTGAATETNSIQTGSGADSITYTDTDWVGVAAAAQGTIVINTRAGNDTIAVTIGTLDSATGATGQALTITGGAGKDSITKVGTNGDVATGVALYVMAAGDSSTTEWDTITGFDMATASLFSDGLDFEGTGAVSAFSSSIDFGVITSHSITGGIATFDTAATFASAKVISASNLADVVGYLNANVAANGTVGFAYDSDASGSADATFVFHKGSASSVANDLVLLVGITGADELISTNSSTSTGDIFIA